MMHSDLRGGTEISKYIRVLLDEYRNDPREKPRILAELRIFFSKESKYKNKVLHGNEFIVVFREKIRKKRLKDLKMFLGEIDPGRYDSIDYSNWN